MGNIGDPSDPLIIFTRVFACLASRAWRAIIPLVEEPHHGVGTRSWGLRKSTLRNNKISFYAKHFENNHNGDFSTRVGSAFFVLWLK